MCPRGLDGRDGRPVGLHGEQAAAAHGDAVEEHGARAADAVLAADVRPREAEPVAEEVGQQQPRLDRLRTTRPLTVSSISIIAPARSPVGRACR